MKNSLADIYLRLQMMVGIMVMNMDYQIQKKDAESELANFRNAVSNMNNEINPYHILFYKKLDYVIPVACQSIVVPVVDFQGNLLNDILNGNTVDNVLQLCVFPFKNESVVLLFMDEKTAQSKYMEFAKQFSELNENDKLTTINFLLSERQEYLFLHKDVVENSNLQSTLKNMFDKSDLYTMPDNPTAFERESFLKEEFSMCKAFKMENILLQKYAVNHKGSR